MKNRKHCPNKMYQEIINNLKPELTKTVEYLKNELNALQVGRATSTTVEDIEVDVYNSKMPIKQLAAINVPDPKQIVIQPWDKDIIKDIEKAIRDSKLNFSPVVDGDVIRLNIPPLNEERRKDLVKILKEKLEECHISIRRQREEAWKIIQELEKEKKITEDNKFKAKDELQKLVDDFNKQIDEIGQRKENEVLRI